MRDGEETEKQQTIKILDGMWAQMREEFLRAMLRAAEEHNQLLRDLQEQRQARNRAAVEAAEARDELQRWKEILHQSAQRVETYMKDRDHARAQETRLRLDLERVGEELFVARRDGDGETRRKLETLEKERDEALAEASKLKDDLATLRRSSDALLQNNAEEIAARQVTEQNLRNTISSLSERLRETEQKVELIEVERDKLKAKLSDAGEELPFWDEKAKTLPEAVRAIRLLYVEAINSIGKEKARADCLAEQLNELKKLGAARDAERGDLARCRNELLAERDRLSYEEEKWRRTINEVSAQSSLWRKRAEELEGELKKNPTAEPAPDLGAAHPIAFDEGRGFCRVCAEVRSGVLYPHRTPRGRSTIDVQRDQASVALGFTKRFDDIPIDVLVRSFAATGLSAYWRDQYIADFRREYNLLAEVEKAER